MVNMPAAADGLEALGLLLRQAAIAGVRRRALLLHAERLPRAVGRQYHLRLARAALTGLAHADRAQLFDLPRGRLAVVWRDRGEALNAGGELGRAMQSLKRLIADMPDGQAPMLGELVSIYELPDQAAWLQDVLVDTGQEPPTLAAAPAAALDTHVLARLELSLAQADLAAFARWRPVYRLAAPGNPQMPPSLAWEERTFAIADVGTSLCPSHALAADMWLYLRLTRTLDRRMLALLGGAGELNGIGGLGLQMNVASLLGNGFLRLDEKIPAGLRGSVVLSLQAADVLADGAAFAFARNFVRGRGYRLLLAGASAPLLAVLDVAAAGFDFVQASLRDAPTRLPAGVQLVITGIERPSQIDYARFLGASLVAGPGVPVRPGPLSMDPPPPRHALA
jgi:hypothetical protein